MKYPLIASLACLLIGTAAQPAFAANDPWITQAFQEVLHRNPTAAEYNIKNYGGGNWSSYNDLLNKVRVRMTHEGAVYIFIKPEQAVHQGHIGWGFVMDDGRYCFGSTENPMKAGVAITQAVWDAVNINPGQDNGFWMGYANTEAEMLAAMKGVGSPNNKTGSAEYPYGYRCSGYWHYKTTLVVNRNVGSAKAAAEHCRVTGFKGIMWNCLDQTYSVLEAYGCDKNTVMPWKQTHPSPNYWFNDFGWVDERTKAASKGNNTSGTAL